MNTRFYALLLWSCVALPAAATAMDVAAVAPQLRQQELSRRYHVTMSWVAENEGYDLSRLIVILPYPQNTQYQSVRNVRLGPTAQLRTALNRRTIPYVRYEFAGAALPHPARSLRAEYEFDVELFAFPRRKGAGMTERSGEERSSFLGANPPFVDPAQGTIRSVSDRLWADARGSPVEYARKAYEYVASGYRYLKPNTGLYPLATLLAQGGGDCGNLSSIYVSLLRAKGIPARHLVGIRPSGRNHVIAEFLAPGRGWMPVDVKAKNVDPAGDYFGRIAADDAIIVLNNDLNIVVETEPGVSRTLPLLQGDSWWAWGRGDLRKVKSTLTLRAKPVN